MSPEVVSIHVENELCARNFKTLPFTCMPCCQAKANVTCDSVNYFNGCCAVEIYALQRRRHVFEKCHGHFLATTSDQMAFHITRRPIMLGKGESVHAVKIQMG